MRRLIATAGCILAATGPACAAASAGTAKGTLTGETQISFGCPGPVAEDSPACNPWHTVSGARFSVAPAGSSRASTIISNSRGRFTLRLTPGSYTVTPLPQVHTHGGSVLRVRVRAGAVTRVLVRFQGFPMLA